MASSEENYQAVKALLTKYYEKSDETGWQECIYDAMLSIPWLPYKNKDIGDTGQGVSEDIYWEGHKILAADPDHPNSFCCGAVMEAYINAIKLCCEFSTNVDENKLRELVKWAFVWSRDKIKGIGEGIVRLGLGEYVDIEDAKFGDLAQMERYYFNDQWDDGHTQIILAKGEKNHKPIFWTWSSSRAKMYVNGKVQTVHGHVVDWFWIYKELNGKKRKWHIARPSEY